MNEHKLKRESSGSREMYTITPTCSCGWRGVGHAAYEDYQHALIKEQEDRHIREAMQEGKDG